MSQEQTFVTVVSGVPRSGTSLMMQMLAAGGHPLLTDGARAPDADNPRGYLEYEPVKATARDASWVDAAAGRAVKVIHALVPHLPPDRDYRIRRMVRPLEEVIASQRAMLERAGRVEPGGLPDLPEARLAEIFREQLAALERWAERQPRASLLAVRYAAVLADPVREATRVDAFLGQGLDVSAMAAAVDPALRRQRFSGRPRGAAAPRSGRAPGP